MKRIIRALIIISCLLCPLNVFACTGVDKQGITYYHDHSNTDETIMPMLYAKPYHLYTKNAQVTESGFDEDSIVSQVFSIPFIQTKESYVGYYWDVDPQLKDLYWETSDDLEKLDLKTTVEGISSLLLGESNFKLNIGLENSFRYSVQHVKNNMELMFYNVIVKDLHMATNDQDYKISRQIMTDRNLTQIEPIMLKIDVEYSITDNNWQNDKIAVTELDDPIEIQIPSDLEQENVVAINLGKRLNSSDVIPAIYDSDEKLYKFEIQEPGIYSIIKSDFDKELFNSKFASDVFEDDNSNIIKIIVLTTSGLIIITIIIIVKRRKTIK